MLLGRLVPIALNLISINWAQQLGAIYPTSRPQPTCQSYEATCNNGECIDRTKVCDGNRDCSDGSDESGCRPFNECEPNEFQCANKKCVLKTWRCDGDDDCGDRSDEEDCRENDPSDPCRYYEWQCASGEQCIPKSFHCDGEMDCQDQSDEVGCTGPTIVISPPPAVLVDQTYTFVINCTAMGIPTPEIVWRLNWGHVPDKCKMTNVVQEGNRAYGELTCTDAQKEDSGAYSCEAINSMGSCFAGSAGCGQPGQDAIVVVSGGSLCPPGYFNSLAVSTEDCLPCFCSGITDMCSSADLFVSRLAQPSGVFQLVSRDPATLQTVELRSLRPERTSQFSQRLFSAQSESAGVPYFSLPSSHTGNLLKSYGGYLRYTVSYQGQGNQLDEPDIVIKGPDMMMIHYLDVPVRSGVENPVEVQLLPGNWFTDFRNGNRATRDDILRILGNVEYLLLKAQQTDQGPIDTTISNILLDSADSSDSGLGSATLVEQCLCPPGYTGLSCERCAPGYERSDSGSCRKPFETCPTGYYADPESGDCMVCPCPLTIPSNQFGRSCRVDTDGQVTCDCSTGYVGRRCGDCAPGYIGNPAVPGGSCTPGVACNYPDGSYTRDPDPYEGKCRCRPGYTGDTCSQAELSGCGDYRFLSREESVPGCIDCFCMGIPTGANRTKCQPSQLFRYKESAVFKDDHLGFSLTDNLMETVVSSLELVIDAERQEISFDKFQDYPQTVLYWRLPYQFLGNKVTSYGGYLEFSLRYAPVPGTEESPSEAPLIEIQGNDIRLFHTSAPDTNGDLQRFKVRIHEDDWKRFDGQPSNREHLLMTLADLDHMLIRAIHSSNTREAGISNVSLECAVNRTTDGVQASAVEGCICPEGYKGLSCEDCAPGFTRSGSGVYLGTCVPCNCNGKSNTCDPESGDCSDCRDYTTGRNCEACVDGFFKDPRTGYCIPEDGTEPACSCDPRGSVDLNCVDSRYCRCKENVEGTNCDRCKPGTFGLRDGNGEGCSRCYCSGVTDECSDARLYWSTMRLNAYDKRFTLTDRDMRLRKDDEVRYNDRTLEYVYQIPQEEMRQVFYWQLPQDVTGNKIGAYGGNLTIIQRYAGRGGYPVDEPAVIMKGGGVNLVYSERNLVRTEGEEMRYKVPIMEEGWVVENTGAPATREDILAALSNIEALLVRASVTDDTMETAIRKTMLDIGVPQMTGGPPVVGAEECRCPMGYSGGSCESCSLGFYRDWTDMSRGPSGSCVRCPCNGNEEQCRMQEDRGVQCVCKAGYFGEECEFGGDSSPDYGDSSPDYGDSRPDYGGSRPDYGGQPDSSEDVPITITMTEPRFQIVEVGKTVRFNCNAMPRFRTQDPMTVAWAKQNGLLPPGRSRDDGQGLLVITSVRSEDSGTYVCTATTGRFVKTETAVLSVGGEAVPMEASISPPYVQVGTGGQIQFQCQAPGSPVYRWSRGRGAQLSPRASVRDNVLYIDSASSEDEGEYICTAETSQGRAEARSQVYVTRSPDVYPPEPEYTAGISINPPDLAIVIGDTAMFMCDVPGPENYQITWSRGDGALPYSASTNAGRLIIGEARTEDAGMYVCRAVSPAGNVLEAQARLLVSAFSGPPSVTIDPEEQTIGQGDRTVLRCIGSGDPSPSLEWTKVGEDLSSPNLAIAGGTLTISNAAVSDRGMYICTAENSGGSARASSILEVERREPPSIEIYPESSQTITKSGSVLFQCRTVAGIPTPVVSWSRVDGRPMQNNVEILNGGVLRINRVTGEEAGQYICKASNQAGATESVANLVIQEIPRIQLEPRGSVSMQVGTPLTIRCDVRADPPPTISWKKIGTTTRQLGVSSPTLEISQLTKEDEGTYACVARNAAGETEERVQIIVLEEGEYIPSYPDNSGGRYPDNSGGRYPDNSGGRYPDNSGGRYPDNSGGRYPDNSGGRYPDNSGGRYPDNSGGRYPDNSGGRYPDNSGGRYPDNSGGLYPVDESSTPLTDDTPASLGSNIKLECLTVGESAQLEATWKRGDGSRFPTRHFQQNGILFLMSVDEYDEGNYVCEVTDNRGVVVYEIEKMIRLVSPPQISLEPQRQTVNPGDSPTILCSADGKEPIDLSWGREDGSQLPYSVSQNGGLLQFESISIRDQGRYVCTARNTDGDARATAEVIVNDYTDGGFGGQDQSERMSASIGATIDIPCRLPPGPVTWSKDGGALPPTTQVLGMSVRIPRVTEADSGRYTCSGPSGTQYTDLRVQPGLECVSGEFECANKAGCVPRYQLCDGEFDCTDGSDEMGCGAYRTRRSLRHLVPSQPGTQPMRRKPTVMIEPSVPRPYQGGSLDISCKVDGVDQASVNLTWTKVGSDMLDNVRTRGNLIRFVELGLENQGLYRCQADTSLGIFYSDYNLMLSPGGPGMG